MAPSTEQHKHSHSRSELNCDFSILGYAGSIYYLLYYTDNRLLENGTGGFLRRCNVSCLVTRSKSNQPAIRKRGNWNDSFAELYNLQRCVLGVMSEQQRRKICLRQDKKNLITDPFQTVATIDLTIRILNFSHNTQYGNSIQLAHYHLYTLSELHIRVPNLCSKTRFLNLINL